MAKYKHSNQANETAKGLEGLRLVAYRDGGGVWTIGYGHTRGVVPGLSITILQADNMLQADLTEADRYVNAYIKVPLNQNQIDALALFVMNLGAGNFRKSDIRKAINEGRPKEIIGKMFLDYVNDKTGKFVRGLLNRRKAEAALYLKPPT